MELWPKVPDVNDRMANDRMTDDLSDWIERQFQRSAAALARAISATHLTRTRKPFRQTVIPAKGSVLASPVIADWNPEPDYFFHWVRDSAIAMKAVAELMLFSPNANEHWRQTSTIASHSALRSPG